MKKKIINKTKNKLKRKIYKSMCMILCISQIIFLFSPTILAVSSKLRNSTYEVDLDTTDTYQDALINEKNGSRYAGRIWSDKSVFRNSITLDKATDGYDGKITDNGDFLHVFSILGSSQRVNSYSNSPIDAIFLLDMSGSMAFDLHSSEEGHPTHSTSTDEGKKDHLAHSRMQKVLDSMNSAINTLMELNEANRVTVIAYGATAEVLMPLAHYKKDEDKKDYLTVTDLTGYTSSNTSSGTSSGAYTVTANAKKAKDENDKSEGNKDYEEYTKSVRNNYPSAKGTGYNKEGNLSETTNEVKYIGYHTNMQAGIYVAFEELYKNLKTTNDVTYKYSSDNGEITVSRIPVAFVMTDGGSNYALKEDSSTENTGDEWHNLPEVTLDNNDNYSNNTYEKYRSENNVANAGGNAVILDILLTTSYMKAKIQNKYTTLLREAHILKENEKADFKIHTISVDTPESEWQLPRVYATLNPKQYFNAIGDPSFNKTIKEKEEKFNEDIINAYKSFLEWQQKDIELDFCDSDNINNNVCKNGNNRKIKFNRLKDEENAEVTNQDVIDNIYYNDDFHDISTANLEETFGTLITNVSGTAFTPVGGENEFGSDDSLTYMDPIGEYMEIKDDDITLADNKTYDMALLLFGKIYGIEKTAIYDSNFNQNHLTNGKFESGWYNSNGNKVDNGNWSNGNVYYLNDEDVKKYVKTEESVNNKEKKYIIYRFAESNIECEKPQKNKSYSDIAQVYYKLEDIKILIEIDEEGNEKLYFNLPTTALPLETVTIQMDKQNEKVESYKTNLDDKESSTPLRLFYDVGVSDDIKMNHGKDIDLDKIDEEYLEKNTTEDNYLKFYSNYYSATTYDGYIADTEEGAHTRGDAFLTLSPSANNRYYIFQKNLKLYTKAYKMENGSLKELTKDEAKNFEGHTYYGEFNTIEEAKSSSNGLKDGDIVTLKSDVVSYDSKDNYKGDDYYYIVAEYYKPTSEGKGEMVKYIVSRKGTEFGSGLLEGKLPKGDFLCWYDASGKNQETYNYSDTIPEEKKNNGANWVLATKIGGLRTGDLHQSILSKTDNKTNTSKSYYLATIADTLSNEGSDAILDAYLGNNGLLTYKIEKWAIPVTGGKGVAVIIMFGLLLIIGSISLTINKYSKKKEV